MRKGPFQPVNMVFYLDRHRKRAKSFQFFYTMRIQATKVLADYINKAANKAGARFEAEFITVSRTEYYNIFGFSGYDRYDMRTGGRAAVIVVSYPCNYYALPVYVNTAVLNKEYKRYAVNDRAGLDNMILDLFSV